MLRVDSESENLRLAQALVKHPDFDLKKLKEECNKRSFEEIANAIAQFLILSFGFEFAAPISQTLAKAKNGYPISLANVYVTHYKRLKTIYEELIKGQSPDEILKKYHFYKTKGFLSVKTPESLMKDDIHFLLSNLPAPFLEVSNLATDKIQKNRYYALEKNHNELKERLFYILSRKEIPLDDSVALHLFTTRCEGMRGIRWIYLIQEWAQITYHSEKANALLRKHPLFQLEQHIQFKPHYGLPPPLLLPLGCSFQEFVCERTLNLMEGMMEVRLPEAIRTRILRKLLENEPLRIRVAFTLFPTGRFIQADFSNDKIETPLLRNLRITINLLKQIPHFQEEIKKDPTLIIWIFNRNPLIEDLSGLDKKDYIEDRPKFSPKQILKLLDPLRTFYTAQESSSKDPSSPSESFDEHAFFLVAHLMRSYDYANIFEFLTFCTTFPLMQVNTKQMILCAKNHIEGNVYAKEKSLVLEISKRIESWKVSPSPLFFDVVTQCPISLEEALLRLDKLIEKITFYPNELINGDCLFLAIQASFAKTQTATLFACDFLKRIKKYKLSADQQLHLFVALVESEITPESKTGFSERNAFDSILKFMEHLDLFLGRPLPTNNTFQLLLFHPNMALREEVVTNLQILAGVRTQLDLIDQVIFPTEITRKITDITGMLISTPPSGFLPHPDEYKTRKKIVGNVASFLALKNSIIQLISQLNFASIGVPIGPGDCDVSATPFFQSFFPLKFEKGQMYASPAHSSYLSLEAPPFCLPHIFYYGQWEIEKNVPIFFGSIVYERTGKTASFEIPLNLPLSFLDDEGEPFFKMLSALYLDTCNEFYFDDERPYNNESISNLHDFLHFYREAERVWAEYHPKLGSKDAIASAVFAFLTEIRQKTRQVVRAVSMNYTAPTAKDNYFQLAAECCLYPNEPLSSLSLLPPSVPSIYHMGFCIEDKIDNPSHLYEIAQSETKEFIKVGQFLISDDMIPAMVPFEIKVQHEEDKVLIILQTNQAVMSVKYPRAKLSLQNIEWQLLMLKGRYYRAIVQGEM